MIRRLKTPLVLLPLRAGRSGEISLSAGRRIPRRLRFICGPPESVRFLNYLPDSDARFSR
jgi:hypothetical protein